MEITSTKPSTTRYYPGPTGLTAAIIALAYSECLHPSCGEEHRPPITTGAGSASLFRGDVADSNHRRTEKSEENDHDFLVLCWSQGYFYEGITPHKVMSHGWLSQNSTTSSTCGTRQPSNPPRGVPRQVCRPIAYRGPACLSPCQPTECTF